MNSLRPHIELLAQTASWPYLSGGPSASEPAAWTALALAAHEQWQAAHRPARWLAKIQTPRGSVGVTSDQDKPGWPTSLAILAWQSLDQHSPEGRNFNQHIDAAVQWALSVKGNTGPRSPQVGHDTTIAGWSWAENTHSWLEPTCFFVQALQAAGYHDHLRVQDGIRMVVDRLLPVGGCNYGNTFALGQMLLPHIQSTGIALSTIALEKIDDPRVEKSIEYLENSIDANTPTASLAFALMGLAAHGRTPAGAIRWITTRMQSFNLQNPPVRKLALLLLAAAAMDNRDPNNVNKAPVAVGADR